ncbi:hypothetical protein CFOL_v3_04506, partial [Cephalotus follicularis]
DIECALMNCGQGTCKASNSSLLGFECLCNPGWKKIQIGPLTFPSCVIPNCTVDFQCGNGSPPPPPPASLLPPPPPPPPFLSNPCAFVWCGDGTCMTNGTGYTCQCSPDSTNLLHLESLACFKDCYLGADCNDLGIGLMTPPPPLSPPPPSESASTGKGPAGVADSWRNLRAITMISLSVALSILL